MFSPPGVEDPISALFDLSDRVAQMAPTVRRMYRYTAVVVVLFLLIMLLLLLLTLRSNAVLAILAFIAIVVSVLALSLLRETDRFFRSFVLRHRAIRLLRDAEPAAKIPEGRTPVERLARYLAQSNPRIGALLKERPEALQYRASVGGIPFDLMVSAPADRGYRFLRWGDPGFAVVARVCAEPPGVPQLERFAGELRTAARKTPGRLVRAILLRPQSAPLPEAVYEFSVGHPVELAEQRVALEIITEGADGSYDFVPHVLGLP
ncbi:MAG: hypothetical protein L3K11_02215 [Thermoplasmata archaeon]|nr:hypothetical protein [Thermoplasmata archaeon]